MKGLTHEQRKRLKSEIVEYRKQGHYASECAEHFGVSVNYVHRSCKGIDYPWKYDTETMSIAAKQQAADRNIDERTAIEYVKKWAPWAVYIGGYTNSSGIVEIKCATCGKITTRSCGTLRNKFGCSNCNATKRHETALKERSKEKENKRIERIRKSKCNQMAFKICDCCGSVFISKGHRNVYCSDECGKRAWNANKKDRRLRKIKSIKHENGITLERLYQKFNGVCALCGSVCDWSDYIIKDGKTFVANNRYPSIDHIVPLAKGGQHTWENVQLACRICNSKKSDAV